MKERLTKRISKTIQDKYSLGSYLYYDFANADDTNKLLNKLGSFEDFIEEQGFESLEELKLRIEYYKDTIDNQKFNYNELHKYKNKLQKENQALKDRWNELKEYLNEDKHYELVTENVAYGYKNCLLSIQNKMQALEKGE